MTNRDIADIVFTVVALPLCAGAGIFLAYARRAVNTPREEGLLRALTLFAFSLAGWFVVAGVTFSSLAIGIKYLLQQECVGLAPLYGLVGFVLLLATNAWWERRMEKKEG